MIEFKSHHGYRVSGPDDAKEFLIEVNGEFVFLTKTDLQKMITLIVNCAENNKKQSFTY